MALLFLVSWPDQASAHAILLRTDPLSSRSLSEAPTEVRLLFSEPIDQSFSRVQVVNASGTVVDRGNSHVAPDDDRELVVSLQPSLPNGVYTVRWRSLSTIDIHPGSGQFPLFVGVPVTSVATATGAAQNESTPETAVARWWLYIAASAFAGTLATWKFVFGPLLVGDYAARRAAALRQAERLALIAGALLLLGTLFAAVAQAAAAADVSLAAAIGTPVRDLLTRGRFATIWWPRLAISLIAVLIVRVRGLDDAWSESAAAMVPAILLTNSLTSHAAALPVLTALAVVTDWIHVLAASIWVGGLASLALLAPQLSGASGLLPRVVVRFSRLALAAVLVIAATGALQAALELGSLGALTGTPYGLGVIAKVGLLLAMLALAGLNQLRVRRQGPLVGPAFTRGVQIELVLGIVALAVAAYLTGTAPGRQAG